MSGLSPEVARAWETVDWFVEHAGDPGMEYDPTAPYGTHLPPTLSDFALALRSLRDKMASS